MKEMKMSGNIAPAVRPRFESQAQELEWRKRQNEIEESDKQPTQTPPVTLLPVVAALNFSQVEARAQAMEDNARAIRSCLEELRRRLGDSRA